MISDPNDPELYRLKVDIDSGAAITQILEEDSSVTYDEPPEMDANPVKDRAASPQKPVPTQGFM